jgi:hypothetical protein
VFNFCVGFDPVHSLETKPKFSLSLGLSYNKYFSNGSITVQGPSLEENMFCKDKCEVFRVLN